MDSWSGTEGDERSGQPAGEAAKAAEFVLELPSDLRVIEPAVSYLVNRCRAFGYRGSRLSLNFRVGVTEALANAILYGNGGDARRMVQVEVSLNAVRVVLRVVDQGEGFDPRAVPDPTRPENVDRTSGRGLFLIRELMDEVEYNDRGNAVCLVLRREPASRRRSSRK
ncbi:MAG TPA: ATP-binding protein [Longimicrobiaceae bacterium]|nr:ATP-binding protein [Longimicrobiaceae bacterium]